MEEEVEVEGMHEGSEAEKGGLRQAVRRGSKGSGWFGVAVESMRGVVAAADDEAASLDRSTSA